MKNKASKFISNVLLFVLFFNQSFSDTQTLQTVRAQKKKNTDVLFRLLNRGSRRFASPFLLISMSLSYLMILVCVSISNDGALLVVFVFVFLFFVFF